MFYVVIPTYNRAHTLIRALKSVVAHDNTHAIVVDDGSSDNTKQLLAEFSDRYPSYVGKFSYFFKSNWWVSDACNYWIERALELSSDHRNDFITRLGSDDEFFPDAFYTFERSIAWHGDSDIFFFQMVNEWSGNRTHMNAEELHISYSEYLLWKKLFGDDANDVIRLSVLNDPYLRFESDLWGGDNILFLKIIRQSHLIAFNIPTYLVHIDTYSMTRSLMDDVFCQRLYNVQSRILTLFGDDYIEINPSLYWLHKLIQARFAWLLGNKKEAMQLLMSGVRYRKMDIVRIGLAILAILPYAMNSINMIIRIFVLRTNRVTYKKKNIPISHPVITQDEIDAVVWVMWTGNIVQGIEVSRLEKSFSELTHLNHAVAVNSGTAAIHCWLYAMGIGPWDDVITSPFTFVASANPILMQGANVVFADVNLDDFLISIDEVKKRITSHTKAVIPVSLYGQVYDYQKLKILSEKYGFTILEDACQSVWAAQNWIASGACGDIGVFSLYATKNIMCWEWGILVTNNKDFADRARAFRQHGMETSWSYVYSDMGYNYRLPDILAAIGNIQYTKLPIFTTARQKNAEFLSQLLSNIPGIILPKINPGNSHVFHQFTIRVTEDFPICREDLIAKLAVDGIGTKIYYPTPIHLYSHFARFWYKEGDFPNAELLSKQALSLPIHPSVSEQDLLYIAQRITFYSK